MNVDLLKQILDRTLPSNNKVPDEPYDNLLENLQAKDIKTSRSLTNLINTNLKIVMEKDRSIIEILRSKGKKRKDDDEIYVEVEEKDNEFRTSYHSRPDRIEKGVYFTHVGLIRKMIENAIQY